MAKILQGIMAMIHLVKLLRRHGHVLNKSDLRNQRAGAVPENYTAALTAG